MKKLMIPVLGLVLTLAGQGIGSAAVKITGGAPLIYNASNVLVSNSEIDAAWKKTETKIHEKLDKYTNQYDLARGFANSGVYSTQIANQNGYTGYDLYFVTVGTQVGAQSPSINPSDVKGSFSEMKDKGDLYIGAAWQIWAVQVGIKADFLLDDLYLGLKFGYANVPYQDFNFKGVTAGLVANYIVVPEKYKAGGSFVWRGVSVGSGLIYSKNDTDYSFKVGTISQTIGGTDSNYQNAQMTYTPNVTIGASSYAVSLPLEVSTAIRLLWCLNLNLGLGMDLSLGSSKIDLGIKGQSDVVGLQGGYYAVKQNVIIDGGTNGEGPHIARPRLMSGVGFEIGPVVLDVPVAWYFKSGFTAGVTVGFRW